MSAAKVKQRIEAFGRARYGSARAGERVVYCLSMLAFGLAMLLVTLATDADDSGVSIGVLIAAPALLLAQEVHRLARRRR